MASLMKIEANRQNASRSTGPRTKRGKAKSSRNAFRHGLAAGFGTSEVDASEIGILAKALAVDVKHGSMSEVRAAAASVLELAHIRKVRATFSGALVQAVDSGDRKVSLLELLAESERLDRYERRAISRKRTAFRELLG